MTTLSVPVTSTGTATIDLVALQTALAALPPIVAPPPVYPTANSLARSIKNGVVVDANSNPIQLRGYNLSGLEFVAAQGWDAADPWGGTFPNFTAIQASKANDNRVPFNAASVLGLNVAKIAGPQGSPAWGAVSNADPGKNYLLLGLKKVIDANRAANCSTKLDLHWSAPSFALQGVTNYLDPLGQNTFMDHTTSLSAWLALVAQLNTWYGIGGWQDIQLELFNEPFNDSFDLNTSAGSADLALLNGGTNGRLVNSSENGTNYEIDVTWQMLGYQELTSALRTAKVTNIIICNGNSYAQQLQNFKTWMPTDPLNQLACGVHWYPKGTGPLYADGDTLPKVGADTQTAYVSAAAATKAGYPVMVTELGGSFGPQCTNGEPFIKASLQQIDALGLHVNSWEYTEAQAPATNGSNYLVTTAGTPTVGQGVEFITNWLTPHK
jgi:hypothetical protein